MCLMLQLYNHEASGTRAMITLRTDRLGRRRDEVLHSLPASVHKGTAGRPLHNGISTRSLLLAVIAVQGVGIAISNRLQPSVAEVSPVNEHTMTLRLKHAFDFVSLIAVYAPTDVCKLDVEEVFYAKLTSVVDKCPRQDIHIVLGNFNAVSSCDRAGYKIAPTRNTGIVAKEIDHILLNTHKRIL
nr:uncharacterized protein LOC113813715 [Penaeus vannamei]